MTVRDAVERARAGASVAICGPSAYRLVDEAIELSLAGGGPVTVKRANGREQIDFHKGGRVSFHRDTASLRGRTLDAAYITTMDALAYRQVLEPCFATRPIRIGVLI